VTVCDAADNCKFIKAADLAIITGMTLASGTLPTLLEALTMDRGPILEFGLSLDRCQRRRR